MTLQAQTPQNGQTHSTTDELLECVWPFCRVDAERVKGALSGLRQILATESSLKMMKNAFYFTSKALFVLKIFKFLYWVFGHEAKQLDNKDRVNFKFYDFTAWLTKNCNTHIVQYLEK